MTPDEMLLHNFVDLESPEHFDYTGMSDPFAFTQTATPMVWRRDLRPYSPNVSLNIALT